MGTILSTMLQRLYTGILRGPSIYARPGRQRIDWLDFRRFGGTDPKMAIATLLSDAKGLEFPARVKEFEAPSTPETEWSLEDRASRDAHRRQVNLLQRLRDIAEDARDFQNDHGESALFVGFPLLWLPRADLLKGGTGKEARVLAPLAFIPVSLEVRRGGRPGAVLSCLGEGADLVIPNPALVAWIEKQTGKVPEEIFADQEGEDPWRELSEMITWIRNTLDLTTEQIGDFTRETPLVDFKEVKELPSEPTLVPSALLGLFPIANLGLLRDTRWMIENEGSLAGPASIFLKPEALIVNSEPSDINLGNSVDVNSDVSRDFAGETLVTHADPCQASAVRYARSSEALVIHGPPGTGKSQTIANIIGDHLARGERVLFVCDKRTAIDVVKYRLDALGLGELCGVVHDPARDRTSLYRQLRDRVENLSDSQVEPDQTRELSSVNLRLAELHGELTTAFRALNGVNDDTISFHEIAGEWLELLAAAPPTGLEPVTPIGKEEVRAHQTNLDEVWRRSTRVGWAHSPWRDRLGISVADFLIHSPVEWKQSLENIVSASRAADEFADEQLLPLDSTTPANNQAKARREMATLLEKLGVESLPKLCTRLSDATAEEVTDLLQKQQGLAAAMSEVEAMPLNPELLGAVQDAVPSIASLNTRLQAIEHYLPLATSLKRYVAFRAKSLATQALAPLGLVVSLDTLTDARNFYRGLRARIMVAQFVQHCAGEDGPKPLMDDVILRRDWRYIADAIAVAQAFRQAALASVLDCLRTTLSDLSWVSNVATNLRMSADRADRLANLEEVVKSTKLFTTEALNEIFARWRSNCPCIPEAEAWLSANSSLEDSVRISQGLSGLPDGLMIHARWHAEHMTDIPSALTAVRRWACECELRSRANLDRALQSIDTERVEAAFRFLGELAAQKQQLVRLKSRRHWQMKQRERLLAQTGTRLNALGASLKQRLVTRGERALKLRQMLATGAATPEGDPIFDLCPVWMTSPSSVAQVFPRERLFDVAIFDEASQCRLEEALPVLLRAKRVVVAGDPKQLPPTRFFEAGLADSTETDAETAEELFEQQQSEVEDLLGAALNLNVQEAFLDVHYRSRDESLIGFSNEQFYGTRLQPIPGHPRNKALSAPLRIHHVSGIYEARANRIEAEKVIQLVAELLSEVNPPSIGVACFNLPQRDLIIDLLDQRAENNAKFAGQLASAREKRGSDSFEGLFVKNLENVQGDERDVMIICTTFAPDSKGKFRRNFGVLSGAGGGRRLNVLVTRARAAIHLITSIPRSEYVSLPSVEPGRLPNGRFFLYAYLRYAEMLAVDFEKSQAQLENLRVDPNPTCMVRSIANPSRVAAAIGLALQNQHALGSIVHWGNDGFCVDTAIIHPNMPADVTIGVLADFNRFSKTPDPVEWELFRTLVLKNQGWSLHRVWTPALLRDWQRELAGIRTSHDEELLRQESRLASILLDARLGA